MNTKPVGIICAVIGGAIAGAALGLLVAPSTGKDTRTKLIEALKKAGVKLKKEKLDELVDEIEEEIEDHI